MGSTTAASTVLFYLVYHVCEAFKSPTMALMS